MSEEMKTKGKANAEAISKLDDRQREVIGYIAEGMALEKELREKA